MTESASAPRLWRESTAWASNHSIPLRRFLQTESGSARLMVAAVAAALVWANVDVHSYDSFWRTDLAVRVGSLSIAHGLRTWIDSGLMTLFFLVVGLEARRELDLGDLRERRRFLLPLSAGVVGMIVPVLVYLAFNAGRPSAHGWGVAMSTDTALALGLLSLVGRHVPDRVRVFLLTVFIVDDLIALVVIGVVYSKHVETMPLVIAILAYAVLLVAARLRMRSRAVWSALGLLVWAALFASGIDAVVAGLAIGLAASAYTPARSELEEATGLVRRFREQPTPELARSATAGLAATLSPNERLQTFYHPWTSYVIVPLFALANAGIVLNGGFLAHAYAAPVTLGVLVGYVVGKPVAVIGTSWLITRLSRGRIRPPVGWAAVVGSGTNAGIGFTVALLIATRAFHGTDLADAKLGALSAAFVASALTWLVYRVTFLLPPDRRTRALLGDSTQIQDLVPEVDLAYDHIRGPADAPITIIEFGDFECPYCGRAEPIVRDLLADSDVRYVWRHLPLIDVHPQARLAAEATEAAETQGAFWAYHDLLLGRQDELRLRDLVEHARQLGLDTDRFLDELKRRAHAARVDRDIESADASGVSGTPTFFINGQRHYGAFDVESLSAAVRLARAQEKAAR